MERSAHAKRPNAGSVCPQITRGTWQSDDYVKILFYAEIQVFFVLFFL